MWASPALITSLILSLLWGGAVFAAEVKGLRVWAGPERTRAVLDVDRPVQYRIFALSNPERIVVDLKRTELREPITATSGGVLKGVRSGVRDGTDLRVVFDLSGKVRPRSFLLEPAGTYGHRLVIDFYPEATAEAAEPVKRAEDFTRTRRDVVVAIDPGHGGEDPGATGNSGSREKNVVLAIARRLAAQIDAEPGMKAVLIRDGDYFVGLSRRYAMAREHKADLFISLHADAFYDKRVSGASVYVLSAKGASSEAARWLAEQENESDLIGGVSLDDKDQVLAAVLLDLSQSATQDASTLAATYVLKSIKSVGKTHKPQVQKAAFVVLKSPDVPSVLVEMAYISNPAEETRLKDSSHQKRMATAMFQGIRNYFADAPPPGSWLAANGTERTHFVTSGDTLSEIAQRYEVSMASIKAANDMNGDSLRTGTTLRIPTGLAGT
jgi:N-acetylmuramoyl-L-alanine amidase